MRGLIEEALTEAGYQVESVGHGAAAVSVAGERHFDAIVLDVLLPGLDGLEVVQVLRRREDRTPVLMLTARDAVADRVAGLDSGADDYLVKPFAFTELLSRLRALLRRDGAPRRAVLVCGPLRLEPVTRVVTCKGQLVELSAREFDLLHFLLRHPNEVLTRTAIAEGVWNSDHPRHSNVVDVYVRYLREKIDRPHQLRMIRTVRGVGYRLACPDRL
ncbi:response regulator transcription factor [soil metagenome]